MSEHGFRVGVLGATGAVGREMLRVLEQRDFPLAELRPLASARSAGSRVRFRGDELEVGLAGPDAFAGLDLVLASAGGGVSRELAPAAAAAGAVVVDNSSAFRMEPDVPLVVPEVNPGDLAGYGARNIVANPNCSTIQMVVALKPLHDEARVRRVVVATYQSTSGAGQKGMRELEAQARAHFDGEEPPPAAFPHPIAFECLPHIGTFLDNAYTDEEMKLVNETRKIMGDDTIEVSPTCVRVPVFLAHSEAVNVQTERPLSPERARELLREAPGVEVVDDPALDRYPLARQAAGRDPVYVGRIRRDLALENGLAMWVVSDNIRKGAALNAVQIAEALGRDHLRPRMAS